MINILFIIVFVLLMGLFVWLRYRRQAVLEVENMKDTYTIERIVQYVKETFAEMVNADLYQLGLSEEEFHRQNRRRNELKEALALCNTGDKRNKQYVVEYIYDLLNQTYEFDEERLNMVIPFDRPKQLSSRDKFDILLQVMKKKHRSKAIATLIATKELDTLRNGAYVITKEDIDRVYKEEIKHLSFEDKLNVIVHRVYSIYKGFGVIDELRDQNIDGISGGVNGLPSTYDNVEDGDDYFARKVARKAKYTSLESIWIMYQGKTIHLPFLSFGSEGELQRIINNLYKFNAPGQLSETQPYIISTMADGSRIVVLRPTMSESWAFFNRKPGVMRLTMDDVLPTEAGGNIVKNLTKFLMRGQQVTAVTGQQGSGKTTYLILMIEYIRKTLNLRTAETAFEMFLRTKYPDRNILALQETDHVSGQAGLDVLKKSDGDVNIIGEIATDQVAAWAVQSAQVASLFTLFSHHGMTPYELVDALSISLLKTGIFSNESSAERQVVKVLDFDIHWVKNTTTGERYIERITEIVPIEEHYESLTFDNGDDMKELMKVAKLYFQQQLKTRKFEARNIIEFKNGSYVAVNRISDERILEISNNLTKDEKEEFFNFIEEYWGLT